MRTIVHLSDLHFGRLDPRLVAPLVSAVCAIAPHLVAVSGDLTQRARHSQFRQARSFLQQLPFPTIVVPGNHDVPLYNIAARCVNPLGGFRRYIARDLQPVFMDEEMIVVGLNSARSAVLRGGGRLNEAQVRQAVLRLEAVAPHLTRIVVTHHPFELPQGHDKKHLIGRSRMAMEQFARVGADLFLAGHLHVSHVGNTAERYQIAGHSALVVQAGTISLRRRGELNSFNVVGLSGARISVDRHTWDEDHQTFRTSWSGAFEHTANGWSCVRRQSR